MITIAKYVVILFSAFLIGTGLLMIINPAKAREYIRKAGSTSFINYFEISVRLIPAAALIIAADISRSPFVFKTFGWFMVITSIVLFFVPRRLHHQYALWCAELLPPFCLRMLGPVSITLGLLVIYSIL